MDVITIVNKSLNLNSNQNYEATLADMRKYVQSLDYGDSAVGLHVDLSKYKVWRSWCSPLNLFLDHSEPYFQF